MDAREQKAVRALTYIIPILKKHGLKWVVTTGFACHLYGIDRPINDIDIDVDASKDSTNFKAFVKELEPYITEPLNHFVDQNYDNYNFEITIDGQIIDICPMAEMRVYDEKISGYRDFYTKDFPAFETVKWNGLDLPVISKELLLENKEILVWKRESDLKDIAEIKKLM
jgi:hypothetical protein